MNYAGIDYSLNCPAICYYNDSLPLSFFNCTVYYCKKDKVTKPAQSVLDSFPNIISVAYPIYTHEMERYTQLAKCLLNKHSDCWNFFIEDYSYGSIGKVFSIAENVAILKYMIIQLHANYTMISPTHVKKINTLKGNASKFLMHETFVAEHESYYPNLEYKLITLKGKSPLSDIIDSYYILKTGLLTR